ncbi:Apoptosis regulatory protein Siva [Frankliniella fusca]|uniref:Apoptosis regulatory protein Siva n=1 Tax=Frankliniella fusca TaxID=407009 RepID=A0AAE1L680_9NEOP|nr:Apoptosis regulatory protein Siva [Frankliniella fusca]
MVKRSCPFSDDMNPQAKIHVGLKEIATGVMSDHHMKLVFDKTKDLLFLGAKKSLTTPLAESTINNFQVENELTTSSSQGSSMRQMRLTLQGQLSSFSNSQACTLPIISGRFTVVPLQKKVPCTKCLVWNPSDMQSCSFCDKSLCSLCCQTCSKCRDLFCTSCSFDVYDISDGHICRNCC